MPLDANDLSLLYDRHAAALLAFFARRTFDSDAALDLLAETFAVAFEDRDQFRGGSSETARAWLYAIARRRLLDFYRRGHVEQRAMARLGVDRRPLTDAEYDRVEELAASQALRTALGEALIGLTAAERDALQLRVVEERPYREVAQELGVTEQTARARVSRGLRVLRLSAPFMRLIEAKDDV